ncbi:MAG: response regulator [Hormoscilla sp. GM102CHS1]|nr:response regulator [Hormoscilla sp. GM102CHS1]
MEKRPAKILVVDDEQLIVKLFRMYFREKIKAKEYELIFASYGKEAIARLQADSEIDMMLTDINMPEMDGLTLLAKLNEEKMNIKTVVISAYVDVKNMTIAQMLGAFEFLNKPIDFKQLEGIIIRALEEER